MFADYIEVIILFILYWITTDNDQQSYQRLGQTSERVRFGHRWTFWAYYV